MAYVPLEDVKSYGRIDGDEDDALLVGFTEAAEEYLANAGVTPESASASLYQLAVKGIVLHWYENRTAVDSGSPKDFEPGIRLVINQLKCASEIMSNLDASC